MSNLLTFVEDVTAQVHATVPNGRVLWSVISLPFSVVLKERVHRYDAIGFKYKDRVKEGELKWQDYLSDANFPFFNHCDGMLTNYYWHPEMLQSDVQNASSRRVDLFKGVNREDLLSFSSSVKIRYRCLCTWHSLLFCGTWLSACHRANTEVPAFLWSLCPCLFPSELPSRKIFCSLLSRVLERSTIPASSASICNSDSELLGQEGLEMDTLASTTAVLNTLLSWTRPTLLYGGVCCQHRCVV